MTPGSGAAAAAAAGLVLFAWGAGCVYEPAQDSPPGTPAVGATSGGDSSCSGGDEGRAFFEKNVLPILDNGVDGAACATCHSKSYDDEYGGPNFLGASPAEHYGKLTAAARFVGSAPSNSILLNKGAHTGPALSGAEAKAVKSWLEIEAKERFGTCTGEASGGEPPPSCKSGEDLLAEFAACMTLEEWTGSGMHMIATQQTQFGPCFKCHDSGTGGNYMTKPDSDPNIQRGFDKVRALSPILNVVAWPVSDAGGECPDIKPSNRWKDKGGEGTHPKYILLSEHAAALDAWFNLTYDKWKKGPCAP